MITILTNTPDELAGSLKNYFLIENHFVFIESSEEIDELLDDWIDEFNGGTRNDGKIYFNLPFLIITTNKNIINDIVSSFDTIILIEINNILEDGIKFIQRGFLPLSVDVVVYYIDNVMLPTNSPHNDDVQLVVFNIFQQLGYLTNNNEPTSRLINTFNETEEYNKYANALVVNMNNELLNTNDKEYKTFLFEILKLIDIVVFIGVYKALNHVIDDKNKNITD